MKIESKTITPAMAHHWLEAANVSNRRLSPNTVAKYAADMAGGSWRNTHQNAIAFYADGALADGQHRLAAVVKSGVPVTMFVATGLDREDGPAIDQGRSRSVGDGLVLGGLVENGKYIKRKVAVAKLLWSIETGSYDLLSVSKTASIIDSIYDGLEFTLKHASGTMVGLGTAAVQSAITTSYYCVSYSVADRFARVLISGMQEGPDDISIIRLRNWLIQGRKASMKDRVDTYKTILRVLHAYENGESLGVIRKTERLYYKTGIIENE